MAHAPASDTEFVNTLRDTVGRYFTAVDEWESTYRRYYRMPGMARPSADLAAEQRVFEERRRELAELLPRARSLCFKCSQADVFAGMLHVSLGEFAPQERTDSAVSRGQRGAIMACLIEMSIACRAADEGISIDMDTPVRKPSLIDRILGFLG